MKKIVAIVLLILLLISLTACVSTENEKYLRIHIRANSNSDLDQSVKYSVKDSVVNFLAPLLAQALTKEQAKNIVLANKDEIQFVAESTLKQNGFFYNASVSVKREDFPTRSYMGLTLESGSYDALIVNLGDGEGDNWWCVVYPPLCFVGGEFDSGEAVYYKSKLWEIINSFLKGTK